MTQGMSSPTEPRRSYSMIDYIEFYRDLKKKAKKEDVEWDISFDEFKVALHTMIMDGDVEVDWVTVH
jgi:hypothetical protein